jgi:phage terminase large subunit GpA-like protein
MLVAADTLMTTAITALKPPPKLTASEWADQYYRTPRGKFKVSKAEYQRGILDAMSDPQVETVAVMASAQVGKSEMQLIAIGYFVTQDPASILGVFPTVDLAKDWSKERLAVAIRLNPLLNKTFRASKARDSDNTIQSKAYPGGFLALVGANSPVGLSSRPMRVVSGDEIDRWPPSAGAEGDPMDLSAKRTQTYWNRKLFWVSTPTLKGSSRIEKSFLESDQRRFYVPCPHCEAFQTLKWSQVKWSELEKAPKDAVYQCEHCEGLIQSEQKNQMIRKGHWQAHAPFEGIAGFHLSELYSPWSTFGEMVKGFLKAKDNKERLMVWVNTSLGETFEDYEAEVIQWARLMGQADPYLPLSVPKNGLLLTAGVDVQGDRLVIVVRAWGRGEESWLVYWQELLGDPNTNDPWKQLSEILGSSFTHESGAELKIRRCSIDSSDNTHIVYNAVRVLRSKNIDAIAIKGSSKEDRPIVNRPSAQDVNFNGQIVREGIKLWIVGVDAAKFTISARLRQEEVGPGYYHSPIGTAQQYYEELCGERLTTRFNNGVPKRRWERVPGVRNEVFDCEVYAYHAALTLGMDSPRWDWAVLENNLVSTQNKENSPPNEPPMTSNWVTNGRTYTF